jgi:Ca2+-binding RTX toxin-like protein
VFDDGNVAAGDTLFVDGAHLHKGQSLISDGSHELDGAFKLHGGNGSDRLIGGAQDDTLAGGGSSDRLTGGLGQDRLVGGKGHDTFIFGSAATSMGTAFDTIVDFVAGTDHIQVKSKITGIDSTISSAVLRTSQFDSDLQAAMQGHLQAHHATLLVAGSGNYAGDTFLVVDQNGTAGYQAGHDLVILMGSSSNVTGLSSGDFTH